MTDIGSYASELILGLVAPVGTDFERFFENLRVCLSSFSYSAAQIRMSELSASFKEDGLVETDVVGSEEYCRLIRRMDAGNAARSRGGGDILALAAAAQIHAGRPDAHGSKGPIASRAHVIRSLKHPAEVLTLRRVYGPGFFLIGVVTTEDERRSFLADRKGCRESEIAALFRRDEHEGGDGQRARDTFELSDVFLRLGDMEGLKRFLNLVFGEPYGTPTQDEYAMFLAFSAALRSADLSRQVGAVVLSAAGDIVAVGTNDVPTAGGGLCWTGPDDDRDFVLGHDTNQIEREKIIDEILTLVAPTPEGNGAKAIDEWKRTGRDRLQSASVMDITEYGRAVHAEMEAMLSCARSGVGTRGATLFSTTFPCHNCAKRIVAAGFRRVVYVEPYPKSRAKEFYKRSISVEVDTPAAPKDAVAFQPFRGVGPRRFFDLFSVGLSSGYAVKRKDKVTGQKRNWDPTSAEVRVPLVPNSYIAREARAAEKLAGLAAAGPTEQERSR